MEPAEIPRVIPIASMARAPEKVAFFPKVIRDFLGIQLRQRDGATKVDTVKNKRGCTPRPEVLLESVSLGKHV
jgi:hypothetical protein